jgi:hypothetical protein
MITAWRIPMLTEQMLKATLRASEHQRNARTDNAPEPDEALKCRLVLGLERLGYEVILERSAA